MIDIHIRDHEKPTIKVTIKGGSVTAIANLFSVLVMHLVKILGDYNVPETEAFMLLNSCVVDTYRDYIEDSEER